MKLQPTTFLLLGLAALAGCSPPTAGHAEHASPDAVAAFFGDNVTYSTGTHLSTNATDPQGKYYEIKVPDPRLARQYGDLALPASNCAYLTYQRLPAAERQQYDYLKVTLQDSLLPRSYTFARPELAQAAQAARSLDTLLARFQARRYQAVVNTFSPSALTPALRASLPASLATLAQQTGPVQQYYLEGYAPTQVPLAGKTQHLLRFFVTLKRPQKAGRMLVVIDPRLRPSEQFLYGLNILE